MNFPLVMVILYLHPDSENDFEVRYDSDLPEPFTIPVWNEDKLGPKKTIAEYQAISETAQFKAWYRSWYRQRKLNHGNTPEQANAKVLKAFGPE